jgi:HEPN domain-containing protein
MQHAEGDLHYARLGADDPLVLRAHVCFHAQQAAEKALKAVLRSHGVDFPPTHDMRELMDLLQSGGIAVPADLEQLDALTPFATRTRYPAAATPVDENRKREALGLAERAVAWARRLIG